MYYNFLVNPVLQSWPFYSAAEPKFEACFTPAPPTNIKNENKYRHMFNNVY